MIRDLRQKEILMNDRTPSQLRTITLRKLALPMLTITFGLQTLRVLFPSIAVYVRDTLDLGPMMLAVYAFIPFMMVGRDTPVSSCIYFIPPRPRAIASLAINHRACASLRVGIIRKITA